MFEAIWAFLCSFGIPGIWVLLLVVAVIVVVGIPVILVVSRWLGLRVRIGKAMTIERAGAPSISEAVSPIKKKTHKDCSLYTDVILIIEATQEHTTEVCAMAMKDVVADQMRTVEQHLDILFASWALYICRQIERAGIPPSDLVHKDIELMMELIACVISEKVKARFHELIENEELVEKAQAEWDRIKRVYQHLISSDIKKLWATLSPSWLLTTLSSAVPDKNATTPLYLLDMMSNQSIELELEQALLAILEGLRAIAQAYKEKEHELHQEFVIKLRKIVNCEYIAEYALSGSKLELK